MLISTKTPDINRQIILILSKYIHENKSKLNLLSTCKFFYNLRSDFNSNSNSNFNFNILYYQRVIITPNINLNILHSLTNVHYIIKNENNTTPGIFQKIKSNILNMITSLGSSNKDDTLIEIFYQNLFQIKNPTTLISNNLTHLKLTGNIDPDLIFNRLSLNLKCLILDSRPNNFLIGYDKIKRLNASIEHFGLHVGRECISKINPIVPGIDKNLVKRIIPINIKYFEFNMDEIFNVLDEFPMLKKIKYDTDSNYFQIFNNLKIPSNIISVSYINETYYTNDFYGETYDHVFEIFLSSLNKNVSTLHVAYYPNFMRTIFPHTITKLKINNLKTDQILPNTIQELHIKNIICTKNKLLSIDSNVTKLIIKYNDRQLLNPNIPLTCSIIYKY